MRKAAPLLAAAWLVAGAAFAQPQAPQVGPLTPATPAVAAPRDVAYPGTLRVQVDATNVDQRIFRVRETIPVTASGPMTLLYPQWLPGKHGPRGALDKLAGLVITANGQRVPWRRDPVQVYAYHVEVPAGARQLDLEFQFLNPTETAQGRVNVTPEMLNIQWEMVVLYPAGHYASRIMVEPSVTLPQGWSQASGMEVARTVGSTVTYRPVTLETFVDSPIFAGRYYRQVDLDPGARNPVRLNIFADAPENLEYKPEQIEAHRNLIRQADRLFGGRPFEHYDFLLALTNRLGGIGLEHHRSSENSVDPNYFTEWDKHLGDHDLLPHEYVHTWNGKFRRGADMWAPNYDVPTRNQFLWVYEGQTQYWGQVLAARSGLWTKQTALDALAMTAANFDNRVGRQWRALVDTTNDPIFLARRPQAWGSWQRNEDYYSEGLLIWLEADTLIRERSGGRRSLDDFARAFFSGDGRAYVKTYTFDEIVQTLNRVEPYDWATFLRTRTENAGGRAPLEGLTRGGYRLVYRDTPNAYEKSEAGGTVNLTYSLGMNVNREAKITSVLWEGPAFRAGLAIGPTLVAVNGTAYTADRLNAAVRAAKGGNKPIELLIRSGDVFRTVSIPYYGGLRYPHLERVEGTPARLDEILTPKG